MSDSVEPAVEQVQTLLCPKLERVVRYMEASFEETGKAYFGDLLKQLQAARAEEDLLAWTIELSKAAFVGIEYDNVSWTLTDEILADAERVSMTFLADDTRQH